jgi:Fe-S cluster biogenesis protein NfuA
MTDTIGKPKTEELIALVEASLDTIRPYLQADGGDVRVLSLTSEHVLKLEFTGNCGSCPMSAMTFKAGVEEAIKKSVPAIKSIEVVNLVAL